RAGAGLGVVGYAVSLVSPRLPPRADGLPSPPATLSCPAAPPLNLAPEFDKLRLAGVALLSGLLAPLLGQRQPQLQAGDLRVQVLDARALLPQLHLKVVIRLAKLAHRLVQCAPRLLARLVHRVDDSPRCAQQCGEHAGNRPR